MRIKKLSGCILFVSLFTFSCFIANCQTGQDSLLAQWQRAVKQKGYQQDTANTILLNKLSLQYLYNNTDSALYFAKQAMELADGQKYTLGQAAAWYGFGSAYYVAGNYPASLDAAEKLLNISRTINYGAGVASSYRITGLIYMAQEKFDDALIEFNKAIKAVSPLRNDIQTGKTYFDIGVCYDESKRSEKAFYYFKKAIAIGNHIANTDLVTMATNGTGEAWFHLKNYDNALTYYQQVIDSKFASNWDKGYAYSGLAQTWYAFKAYDKAVLNAQKSLGLARKVKSQGDAVRALGILSDSYAALKDYKSAYQYQNILKRANDSIFNSEKEKGLNYLHLKEQRADNARLEIELKAKEESIAFSKRLAVFRDLLAVCVAIFVILIVRSNRQKTKLNKALRQQKEEIITQKEALDDLNSTKDQLFSVISHDLRSPFTTIIQTMNLMRSGHFQAEEQNAVMEDFYKQVNLVSLMVNNLLIWAASQQSGIKAKPMSLNITETINGIISVSNYLAKSKNITIKHQYDEDKWAVADADHVKIIIQNLIGNAIKFTLTGGTIEIYYTVDDNYQIIHVKDSGVGMSATKMDMLFKVTGKAVSDYGTNNEAGAGIGLALIKQFVDANNGKITVKSKPGEGSEFEIYLKKI